MLSWQSWCNQHFPLVWAVGAIGSPIIYAIHRRFCYASRFSMQSCNFTHRIVSVVHDFGCKDSKLIFLRYRVIRSFHFIFWFHSWKIFYWTFLVLFYMLKIIPILTLCNTMLPYLLSLFCVWVGYHRVPYQRSDLTHPCDKYSLIVIWNILDHDQKMNSIHPILVEIRRPDRQHGITSQGAEVTEVSQSWLFLWGMIVGDGWNLVAIAPLTTDMSGWHGCPL